MNNRIKELIPTPWTFPYPDREMYSKEQMEQLGKQIAKECLAQIAKQDEQQYLDDWDRGYAGGIRAASRSIKDYFEIEE